MFLGQTVAGRSTAGPAGAADAAPMAHAEALVALAAAVQVAQRAMQATFAEAASARPGEAAAGRHRAGLAKALATGLMRLARQGAQRPARCAWRRLYLLAFQARQHPLDWHQRLGQRQLHWQALAALGPAGLSRLPASASAGSAEPASVGSALPTPEWIDQAPITAAWPEVAPMAGQPTAAPSTLADGHPAPQGKAPLALTRWAGQARPVARAGRLIAD